MNHAAHLSSNAANLRSRLCPCLSSYRSPYIAACAAISLSLLGACALESARIERPAPTIETKLIVEAHPPSVSDRLLQYMVQIRVLNGPDLQAERERVRVEFAADKSEFNRLKLALALALPSLPTTTTGASGNQVTSVPTLSTAVDDSELITLTEPITTVSNAANGFATEPEVRALAMLIQSIAQDRKRLRDQTKEIQTKAHAKGREEAAASEKEARNLRLKVEELEKQLIALKSIERSINSRNTDRSDGAPK
jgi:hypothetical protein